MNQTKLHTKQDLLAAITSNREVIKGFGVCNLGLFGSFSKGTFNETSDVDLLVDFFPEQKTFDNFMELSFFFGGSFGKKSGISYPPVIK